MSRDKDDPFPAGWQERKKCLMEQSMLANQVVGAEDPHLFDVPSALDQANPLWLSLKEKEEECRKLNAQVKQLREALEHIVRGCEDDVNMHDGRAITEISYGEFRQAQQALDATKP